MKRLLKIRMILAVLLLGAIALAAYWSISPNLTLDKQKGLGEIVFFETKSWPEGDAFHLGDSIKYFIEIKYDFQSVEIDKSSLDGTVVLKPFEIRSQKEKEFKVDYRTNVYLREYELQLLRGSFPELYAFPEASLRYKLRGSDWLDSKIVLQPIPIGTRFLADAELELKPIDGYAADKNRQYIFLMLMGSAALCAAWLIAEIYKKISGRKKESKDFQKNIEGIEDIFKSYRELLVGEGDPKAVLHGAYQILRTLLSRKEGIDWLCPKLEKVPPGIRTRVDCVLDISGKAYGKEVLGRTELDEALRELGKIFDFYVGKRGKR